MNPRKIENLNTISVTVDTEEEGLWGAGYPIRNCTTLNLRGLPRFHSVCEKYSIPPTYLVDAPVLENDFAIEILKDWQDTGRCEIGTHCHPWCTPPIISESVSKLESYMCNLPEELQFEKLQWLTQRIADTFGRAPTSYRAGRYGFNRSSVGPLVALNYIVDSSVLPAFNYTDTHGPNFQDFNRTPCKVRSTLGDATLLEVPITTGFTRSGRYQWRQRLRGWLNSPIGRATKIYSISNRLGLTRHIKLSPEGTSLVDLKGLVRSALHDGVSHLVLMLHSTSLLAGFSPYAKNDHELEALYQRLDGILEFTTKECSCVGVMLSETTKLVPDGFHR